ncbi:hypothetical protein H1R20_g12814, partial [Candolleomyces eurysporus]
MKNVILPRLLVIFYIFLSLPKALAVPTAIYVSVKQEVLSNTSVGRHPASGCSGSESSLAVTQSVVEPGLVKPADDFNVWLKANGPKYEKICFYSGASGDTLVYDRMDDIAWEKGCTWIDALIEDFDDKLSTEGWTDNQWKMLSTTLAKVAHDEAIVILGEWTRPGNMWDTIEWPILQNSDLVTKVAQYTMDSTAEHKTGNPTYIKMP